MLLIAVLEGNCQVTQHRFSTRLEHVRHIVTLDGSRNRRFVSMAKSNSCHSPQLPLSIKTSNAPASHTALSGRSARHKHFAGEGARLRTDHYNLLFGPLCQLDADLLQAVIAADGLRSSTPFNHLIQSTHHTLAG